MNFHKLVLIFTIVFFIMFIYSGIEKIYNFDKKVTILDDKLKPIVRLPKILLNLSMYLVIFLEIIGPIVIFTKIYYGKNASPFLNMLSDIVFVSFIVFLILVTVLYHQPSVSKIIPFLSNCTTLAGLIFLYIISKLIV